MQMKKISNKITLVIAGCSCISLLLVGLTSMRQVEKSVRGETKDKLVWMARSYAAGFSAELDVIEKNVKDIALEVQSTFSYAELVQDEGYLARYADELAPFLENFANNHTDSISAYCYFNPDFSDSPFDIYYVDGDGDGRADRQPQIPLSYYEEPPVPGDDKYWWFGPVKTGKLCWTNPYEWTLVNGQVIKVVSCAMPVYQDGKLIAVVGSYYRFDAMSEAIREMEIYESGYAMLLNEKLDYIVHPIYQSADRYHSENLATAENGAFTTLSQQITQEDSSVLPYRAGGQGRLFAYSQLSNGWTLAVSPPVSECYAPIYALAYSLLLVIIGCIILSIAAARALGLVLARPIQTLRNAALQIGGGDFDVRVDLPGRDEIHELGDTLNEMAVGIKKLHNDLSQMAYFDPLTGLGNKNHFEKNASALLAAHCARYAYVILDINKFKIINDLFGLDQGDLLLCHMGNIVRDATSKDEACARFNADCFHMLLHYQGRADLEHRLRAISDAITDYAIEMNAGYKLSVGFGVYVVEEESSSVSLLGDKAMLALSKIKGAHSFAIHFYNDNIRNKILEEQEIENSMEAALANGEFKLYIQPKYDPRTETIQGGEALVRWVHPEKGIIPPDQFIPVFERNGFIADLDLYMLEQVCILLRGWLDAGIKPLRISVNQSRRYLNLSDYITSILKVLEKYNISPELIELEITETAFFEDQNEMIKIVRLLHEMGFGVSLDDFGTVYSSFSMLQDILVDVLKIDKNFFRDSVNSDRGKKIVLNILLMAHELNIVTVAEGVETAEQVALLREADCDLIQGYYYARPMPWQELDAQWRKASAST